MGGRVGGVMSGGRVGGVMSGGQSGRSNEWGSEWAES